MSVAETGISSGHICMTQTLAQVWQQTPFNIFDHEFYHTRNVIMYEEHFKLTSAQDRDGYLLWHFMYDLSRKQNLCKSEPGSSRAPTERSNIGFL